MPHNHKFESNRKYFTISVYSVLVILVGCIIFRLITQWSTTEKNLGEFWNVITPFFLGFLIAYILNPVIAFFQRNIFSKIISDDHPIICHWVAITFSYILFVTAIVICLIFIIPQVIDSVNELSRQVPAIYKVLNHKAIEYQRTSTNFLPREITKIIETRTLPRLLNYSNQFIANLIPWLYTFTLSLAKWIFNIFIAFVVSIYVTIDKRRIMHFFRKIVLAFFSAKTSRSIFRTAKDCHVIFSSFIIGKSLDSLIIGIICFFVMSMLNLPFTVLISVIVGITNMIPYFGPFIGAIPSGLILLIISPSKALIFIIMVFILQQFDGLYLGPKILGNSTGVRPLLILISITIGGAYFGPLGMFLGVPIFACVQYLVDRWLSYCLVKKGVQPPSVSDS